MKTFDQLTLDQRIKAIKEETDSFLGAIIEGVIQFEPGEDLQARIDKAWKEMEGQQTPWFIGERIMETCRVEIELLARASAESAMYLESGEHVAKGIW